MVATSNRLAGKVTYAEVVADATWSTPQLLTGDILIQATQGTAGSMMTIHRHPISSNNFTDGAPATNDLDWAPYEAGQSVAGDVGGIVRISEPGVAWYRFQLDHGAHLFITGADPAVS